MNRFWVRILVFVGLMTAAGVIWGILEAALFTRSMILLSPDAPGSNAVWAFPASMALVLFAVWLAARTALGRTARVGSLLLGLHFALLSTAAVMAVACTLADLGFAVPVDTVGALVALGIVSHLGEFLRLRRERRGKPKQLLPREQKEALTQYGAAVAAVMLTVITISTLLSRGQDDLTTLARAFPQAGFSIVIARLCGEVGAVDFERWLGLAALFGGLLGMMTGVFLVSSADQPGSAKKALRRAAFGFPMGAAISGLMFGGHAAMLTQTYHVAWNPEAVLVASLWVWGILGVIGGLMLACAVHVASTEPLLRLRRAPLALALTVPPVLLASAWAADFVRVGDVGRDLLARAQKLEGQTFDIGFWPKRDERPVYRAGRRMVQIRRSTEADSARQARSYWHTTALCRELVRRYPSSAYRSAALHLKYEAMSHDWQPREALETRARLFALYPRAGYPESGFRRLQFYDLMLLGNYEDAVRLSRSCPQSEKRFSPWQAEAYAAEVLGMRDDLIRIQQARLADFKAHRTYRSPTYRQGLAKWEAAIRHAESMKAKGVGPRPRTDVSGRVLLGGKPLSGVTFCILPVRDSERDTRDITPTYAAAIGGRVAETDASGAYTIQRVPSGRYQILLVLHPSMSSGAFKVSAPGVPYNIKGASVRLPDIVLTPSAGTKP